MFTQILDNRGISEIKVQENKISSAHEMAEAFNAYVANIGPSLSNEIPETDINPEDYIKRTNSTFTLKSPSYTDVCKLLSEIDERKATGLDGIPCKLLKLASYIVGPPLSLEFLNVPSTQPFSQTIGN